MDSHLIDRAHQLDRYVSLYNSIPLFLTSCLLFISPESQVPQAMAPSALQGLNLVHPVQQSYLSDSQDLLSNPHFPELNAQLDLWTNLAFQSDEPLLSKEHQHRPDGTSAADDDFDREEDEDDGSAPSGPAHLDSHDNVVLGNQIPSSVNGSQQPPFDLNAILAGLGVDPFALPPFQQPQNQLAAAPSLQQILSLYPAHNFPSQPPAPSTPASALETKPDVQAAPPAKRARTRKASISTSTIGDDSLSVAASPVTPDSSLTPSEDKRRRNTAASARFRLKKKEREAALEKKAKELESRVSELERECEGLRRENGWLKGLVVGVTGAGSNQQQQSTGAGKRAREGDDA